MSEFCVEKWQWTEEKNDNKAVEANRQVLTVSVQCFHASRTCRGKL